MSPLRAFRSMGCAILVGGATPDELTRIEDEFQRYEAVFSRFRPESELTHVNASAGRIVPVSPLFAETLRVALDIAAETGGLVDPTLGEAIEAAGYDRDFPLLQPDPRPVRKTHAGCWTDVGLEGRVVALPPHVRLDLNGVVKALAVDRSLGIVSGPGFVSAGGDLAANAELDVGLPGGGAVRLMQGALATSGTATRRWKRGGVEQHHLLDARTGRPALSRWEQVSVAGQTCLAADAAAKAAFLLDEDGPEWLDERGLPGRFVTRGGEVVANQSWRAGASCARRAVVCT